jgi:ferritin-like metal-binding protein YciE
MVTLSKSFDTLFLDTLKDIYYAEKKILKALPKMTKEADSEKLASAFELHRVETENQIERLEKVFEILGKRPQGKICPAIDGILEEGEEIIEDYQESSALDAGLISAAQAVEHYEISRYVTLKRWAHILGMNEIANLLDQNLSEEIKTDGLLTRLADSLVNNKALKKAA